MDRGQTIKALRESIGLTQEELGKACGTTKQTIFKYEMGIITNIPMDRLCAIAKALKVTPAHLMGWEEPTASGHSDGYMMIGTFASGLTDDEQELLDNYRMLNDEAKAFIADNARNFASMDKYKKDRSAAETA